MVLLRTGVLLLTGFVVFAGVVRAQLPRMEKSVAASRPLHSAPEP